MVLYMLRCRDGSLYTGITADLERRVALHQAGKGSKYVASRLPVEVVYQEGPFATKGEALRRELCLKKMNKRAKEALIPCAGA